MRTVPGSPLLENTEPLLRCKSAWACAEGGASPVSRDEMGRRGRDSGPPILRLHKSHSPAHQTDELENENVGTPTFTPVPLSVPLSPYEARMNEPTGTVERVSCQELGGLDSRPSCMTD